MSDVRFYRSALESLLRGICSTTHFPDDWEDMAYVQQAKAALAKHDQEASRDAGAVAQPAFVGEWHRRAVELGYDGVAELIAFALPCIVNSGGDERATQPQGGEVAWVRIKNDQYQVQIGGNPHNRGSGHHGPWIQAGKLTYSRPHDSREAGDARRYRWLREQNANLDEGSWMVTCMDFTDEEGPSRYWPGVDLDAAIDAALAAIAARGQGDKV